MTETILMEMVVTQFATLNCTLLVCWQQMEFFQSALRSLMMAAGWASLLVMMAMGSIQMDALMQEQLILVITVLKELLDPLMFALKHAEIIVTFLLLR